MNSNNRDRIDTYLNDLYFHDKRNGIFLQAGAYDGVGDSITYAYQKQLDWRGLLLEPNKRLIDSIKSNRQSDIILNVGLGDTTQIIDFQYLPSRMDSSGFDLSLQQKNKLRKIGFNGQVIHQKVQVFAYQDLLRAFSINKLDLAVIDVQGYENKVLSNIVSSQVKPTFLVVQHIHSNRQQLLNTAYKHYDMLLQINKDFIFKRRYTVLIITRCTRLQNLPAMLESLNKAFKGTSFDFLWYVAVDSNKVSEDSFKQLGTLSPEGTRNRVIVKYIKHTQVCAHASDLLNIALFDEDVAESDFVYTLDDDNLVHPALPSIIYDNIQTAFDMLLVNCQDYITDHVVDLTIDCYGKVDTANMVFNYHTLKNIGGYGIKVKTQNMIEDALTCSKFIQLHKKLVYTNKTGAYYNKLNSRRVAIPIA